MSNQDIVIAIRLLNEYFVKNIALLFELQGQELGESYKEQMESAIEDVVYRIYRGAVIKAKKDLRPEIWREIEDA